MVVFDAAVLTLLLWDEARPPNYPGAEDPVERCKDRMELLVQTLHKSRETIVIPTPALSEVLVASGRDGLRYVKILEQAAVFRIQSFDTLSAIELAEITRAAIDRGDIREGEQAPWQLIKIDRQIVAIAKVTRSHTIYTDDRKLRGFAQRAGLNVVRTHELPLPPEPEESRQLDWVREFEAQNEQDEEEAEIALAAELEAASEADDAEDSNSVKD